MDPHFDCKTCLLYESKQREKNRTRHTKHSPPACLDTSTTPASVLPTFLPCALTNKAKNTFAHVIRNILKRLSNGVSTQCDTRFKKRKKEEKKEERVALHQPADWYPVHYRP